MAAEGAGRKGRRAPGRATADEFWSGGGELGARIRAFDWSATPLGPPAHWPQSLKTATRIMLASRQPIWIGWGPELNYLYNDPYKSIIGGKHPDALGRPTREVWGEIWDDIGPLLDETLEGGEGTYSEEQLLIMERHGYQEETYYTFSYTSIPDDNGGIGGVICANTDDTQRIIAERQLALLKELAGSALHSADAFDACAQSAAALETNPRDLPFAMVYLADADASHARLAGAAHVDARHPAVPVEVELAAEAAWPIGRVLGSRQRARVELAAIASMTMPSRTTASVKLPSTKMPSISWPSGPWRRPPTHAILLPILPSGEKGRTGVLVAGLNPLRQLDAGYLNFLNLVTAQIASSVARADAFQAERRRAAALAEIDRAKTIFFSNASHEFRTPLSLMLGPLQDILARQPAGATVEAERGELELMQRNGARLLKLVNSLLDFSRMEAGRVQAVFEPVDLPALTAELASTFRSAMAKAGLRFIVDCPPMAEPLYADRDMWEKIVLNLLSNAFKYTLHGEVEVALRAAADGAHVELSVRDTGVGVPEAQLPRLFERFHRIEGQLGRTQEGTGIGLALVQELVRFHGGSVAAESGVGHGTRLVVSIPRGAAHLPPERIRAEAGRASTGAAAATFAAEALRWLPGADATQPLELGGEMPSKARALAAATERPLVLLADDNADMRDYVRRLLSERYDVHAVGDGQAALDAARARRPDLVLSDVMMPLIDGFALLRALRQDKALREVPFILLSARAGEEASVDGLEAGADDYLAKPFSARELLARVGANLDLARLRREAVRVENELRRQAQSAQERAETILASISDGFMALDRNWCFTYLNAAAERILGRSAGELMGRNHWDEYPDIVGSPIQDQYRRAMADRVSVAFENFYAPWGRWFDIRVFPARDGGLSIYFQDITERKSAEDELRDKNVELETVLDAVPAAVWIARDAECRVITGNQAAATLLDLPKDANASVSAPDGLAPSNFRIVADGVELRPDQLPIQRAAATGEDVRGFEETLVFDDGRVRTLYGNAAPLRDRSGRVRGSVGAFIDITELAQARKLLADSRDQLERTIMQRTAELHAKEARVRSIFETSFTYQGLMALDGTLLDANATSLQGIAAPREAVIGKPFWQSPWFAGTPGMPETVRDAIPLVARGEVVRQEIHVNLPVGGWRWFDFQMRPVRDGNGAVVAIVPEAVETTARREAEEALRHAQKMEAIGQLTGGVAHDFNNLLTIIRSAADLLRKPKLSEERRLRYMDAIADTADRAARLTSQLLAFSRRQALSAQIFDVAERVEGVADMLGTVLGSLVALDIAVAGRPLLVEADANQFETALVNLAANARDAMDGKGALSIRVAAAPGRPAGVAAGGADAFVAVSVTDDGCGIAGDQIDKIFEPFYTTKEVGHGTGLGLSQVYGFAKQSGGTVAVDSVLGKGATFTLYLPRSAKPLPLAEPQAVPDIAPPVARGSILVVEDNAEVGAFTRQVLDELGYDSVLAGDAEAALALLVEGAGRFDLVFSDVMMPGIDGIALGHAIRERFPGLPFLLTSGYSQVLAEDGKSGFDLLHKPYTVEGIAKALRHALGQRQAT